jgi:formylglycine-generating enzyme required for sulfatase activity
MGSSKHYPEERPVHRVSVDGFWMDRYPVTNARFEQFIAAENHLTFAEIPPDPRDYPGALPHMLVRRLTGVREAGRASRSPEHRPLVAVHARRGLAPSTGTGQFDRRKAEPSRRARRVL